MARLVPLHVGFSIAETVCIRAMLAAYGIPSAAPAFHHIRNNWFFVMASGGIEVHVFEHDAEAARALLRSPFRVLAALLIYWFTGAPLPLWVTKRRFMTEQDV